MSDWIEVSGVRVGDGSAFGIAEWDRGDRVLVTHDAVRPNAGGRILGRDVQDAPEWSFVLYSRTSGQQLLTALRALAVAWSRSTGDVIPLRFDAGYGVRRVYGRPRAFHESSTPHGREAGVLTVDATFRLSSPLHFSDDASTVRLPIVPASPHGLRFTAVGGPPLRWASADGEPAVRAVTVGGDAPAPVTVTVHGPLSAGWVRIGGTTVRLGVDLAYDEQVTVDALAMSITRGDGASWPGALAASTRMADLYLPPGTHDAYLGGIDVTGTAWASVTWRDAWRSL